VRLLLVHHHSGADASRDLEARLVTLGHEVAAVVEADAAVAQTESLSPDLVLVHLATGGDREGRAVAAAIPRHRAVPVVLLGGEVAPSSSPPNSPREWPEVLSPSCSDGELRLTLELAHCRHEASTAVHELHEFFDTSHDMFCFLDYNGYFRRLNPAWERTLGFSRAELMARPFIEFVHPDDRELTLDQNARVRAGDQAKGFENRYLCKDGSFRWFLWNATPQSIEQVIYSVARDITVRRQAEADRATLIKELEASLAEVSALQEILPICSYCRRIRDDEDYWHSVENYISRHTRSRFSHGICPRCMQTEVEADLRQMESP